MTDYFSFFDLSPSPTLDGAELKRRFYANSKRFHPDFHTLGSETDQEKALEQSTLNNQAYKHLRDPDLRLKHLLDLRGALGAEGTNQVPQDFLMEIMEVNEALMELEFAEDEGARTQVQNLISELAGNLDAEIADVMTDYDDTTVTDEQLQRLTDYYLKKRYLLRLQNKL